MERFNDNRRNSYNLSNCFGFDEKDIDLIMWEKSSILNETNAPLDFQPNKPYRLALYVRPSEQKHLRRAKAGLVNSTIVKQVKNKLCESDNNNSRVPEKEIKKRKEATKKVMLFDENIQPENISKKTKKALETTQCEKSVTIVEPPSTRKNILREVNTKSFSRTKQNKIRRSYEKKFKEKDSENISEPPSEEIIKEMEFKKLSRTKPKKTVKEDQEFEKWANSMNSAFDDVEKFELSITYD